MTGTQSSNPFVGLRPFESDESLLFFGREEQITELLQRLHAHHFLAVIGSSGSGKSSLIRAGLIPKLKAGYLVDDRDKWMIGIMKPGSTPLFNLVYSILNNINENVTTQQVNAVVKKIKDEGSNALLQILEPLWQQQNSNIFLLIDQFEELFRFSNENVAADKIDEANDFVNILLDISNHFDKPIYTVITMRSDFVGDCSRFFGLPEAMNQSQYLVPRLSRIELRNVIESPIKLYGAKINTALTARLLNDLYLTKDELPVLQHALMRTWEVWKNKDDETVWIDIPDYLQTGTMDHALSLHAEEAYAELSDAQKLLCEKIFKALTEKEADARGIRRPQRIKEIAAASMAFYQEVTAVVDVFRKPGRAFLLPAGNIPVTENSIIDISHESLMRVWDRLVQWVDEEYQSEQIYVRLSEDAVLYETGMAGLWRNPELQLALNWQKESSPNQAWAKRCNNDFNKAMFFLEKSREQYEDEIKQKEKEQKDHLRRARIFGALISTVAVIAILFAIYAFKQTKEANEANERTKQALFQQRLATQLANRQTQIADSERMIAETSQQLALLQKDTAQMQKNIADTEKQRALLSQQQALHQEFIAIQQTRFADSQKNIALEKTEEALRQQDTAEKQKQIATIEKQRSDTLKDLAKSINIANEAVLLSNENHFDSSRNQAVYAYELNRRNGGSKQNNDIYNALYINWARGIQNKNINTIHKLPVHCITVPSNINIIFSADESGIINEFRITDNGFQKLSSYATGKQVRAMAVSSNNKTLIVATFDNECKIFDLSNNNISYVTKFKFSGIPRTITFNNNNFFLLTSEGISRYTAVNIKDSSFIPAKIQAFTIGKSGSFYVAKTDQVIKYSGWNQLLKGLPVALSSSKDNIKKITSVAVDESEQYIAAGTYDGSVWIKDLSATNSLWNRTIHLSSVNDLKFSVVDGDMVQLAAAGADQTIKLLNVKNTLLYKNTNDVITLNGHTKWIYALCYTHDGQWLVSAGEDDKVIAWKPTMNGLYQSLVKH